MGEAHISEGRLVEVTNDRDGLRGGWYVAKIIKLRSDSNPQKKSMKKMFLVEYQSITVKDERGIEPLRVFVDALFTRPLPPKDDNGHVFKLNDEVDAFYRAGWWEGVVTRVLQGSRYVVFFRNSGEELEFQQSDLRVHLEWINGRWIPPEEQQKVLSVTPHNLGGTEHPKEACRVGTTVRVSDIADSIGNTTPSERNVNGVRLPAYASNSSEKTAEQSYSDVDLLLSNSVKAKEGSMCQLAGPSVAIDAENGSHTSATKLEEINPLKCSSVDKHHTEIGIPRPWNGDASQVSCPLNLPKEYCKDIHPADLEGNRTVRPPQIRDVVTSEFADVPKTQLRWRRKKYAIRTPRQVKEIQQHEMEEEDIASRKRGRSLTENVTGADSPRIGVSRGIQELYNAAKNSMISSEKVTSSGDQSNGSSLQRSEATVLQFADYHGGEQREEQKQMDSPPVDKHCNEILPFVKSSFMWENIESMEVFQKLPQSPHFRPLEKFSLAHREGMAIGHMVTFVNLVTKIIEMQPDKPKSDLDEVQKALADLASLGFNVKKLEARVQELLKLKRKQDALENKTKATEKKIIRLHKDNIKVDTKFAKLKDCVSELETSVSKLKERRELIMTKMEKNDSDIAKLQGEQDTIRESNTSIRHEFDSLVSSPW